MASKQRGGGRRGDEQQQQQQREPTYVDRERDEIDDLERKIKTAAPASGVLSLSTEEKKFSDMPLSKLTLRGLQRGKFEVMTEIQRQVLPHALAGRDILGAAKTGSGKTLSYLIPLVEDLFRQQWSREEGLGAMVISPTRELALQIFEVLKVLLHAHVFTGGLLLGGTDFATEQRAALKMQVVVCTPGRALQHLEQTPGFECSSTLRVLVLDEADRLLDMGFRDQLEAIVSYTPRPREEGGNRQTMLFSATQTKSIKDLARLSLKRPEYISVHEKESQATPENLRQLYLVSELGEKLDVIFSFIKSHLKTKTIIFFSSCKQVKFMDVAFRRMRPGVPVLALHGKQSPTTRTSIYESFCSRPAAVLFATDVAARGLDFPNVDWVVQADCPEDPAAYIHRVGRTARYKKEGNALLVLLPSEEKAFLALLKESKIPIKRLGMNPLKRQSIQEKMRAMLIADTELKLAAQKAFKSYLRSVNLQTNRQVFDVKKLAFKEFAASLGLSAAPRIKFTQGGEAGRAKNRELKNRNYLLEAEDEDDELKSKNRDQDDSDAISEASDSEGEKTTATKTTKKATTKWERVLKKKPLESRIKRDSDDDSQSDEDDHGGLELKVKKSSSSALPVAPPRSVASTTAKKRAKPLRITDTGEAKGTRKAKVMSEFDEATGEQIDPFEKLTNGIEADSTKEQREQFVKKLAARLREEDIQDRELNRKRVKDLHREQKAKKKAQRNRQDDEEGDDDMIGERPVVLGAPSDEDGSDQDEEVSQKKKRSKPASKRSNAHGGGDEEDMEQAALRLIETS